MSTKINIDVKKIVSRLMSVYGIHKPKEVADKLGVSSQVLNNWISRNSPAALDKIREVISGDLAEEIIMGPAFQVQVGENPTIMATGNGIAANGHVRVTTHHPPHPYGSATISGEELDRITADVVEEMQKMNKKQKIQVLNACLDIMEKREEAG